MIELARWGRELAGPAYSDCGKACRSQGGRAYGKDGCLRSLRLGLGSVCRRDTLLAERRVELLEDSYLAQLAWLLWERLQSQWNVGVNGAIGLFYGSIESTASLLRLPYEQLPEVFEVIQELEVDQIRTWAAERAERTEKENAAKNRKGGDGEDFVIYGSQAPSRR